MGTDAIRVTGASRVFRGPTGDIIAFRDLDFEVGGGELHALLGPSGCGKSTLLRVLAGLDQLTTGELEVPRHPDGRVAAGIVFQQAHLLPWLTVRENTALGLRYRANRHIDGDGVDDLLATMGLSDLADALPDELSGGQAQRVAIARTIVPRPSLLLLDEPFAALDPLTRRGLQQWLTDLREAFDLTVLLVTHDVDEALHLGDRTSLLHPRGIVGTWQTTGLRRDTPELAAVRDDVLDGYAETRADVVRGQPALVETVSR